MHRDDDARAPICAQEPTNGGATMLVHAWPVVDEVDPDGALIFPCGAKIEGAAAYRYRDELHLVTCGACKRAKGAIGGAR